MDRRVFIGLPAGEGLRQKAGEFRAAHRALSVRWTPPENLHVTLVPPWRCGDIDAVCEALAHLLADTCSFDAVFTSVSGGPSRSRPRLLWASGGAHEGLGTLSRKLSALAGEGNGEVLGRDFLLHVTLARLKNGAALRFHPEIVDWRCAFDRVRLYESVTHPGGAVYRALCDVVLKGGGELVTPPVTG